MQTTIIATILGATRYQLDNGTKGATVYMVQEGSATNENVVGNEVMKAGAPYEIFDRVKLLQSEGAALPGPFDVLIDIGRGGGDKTSIRVLGVNRSRSTSAAPVSPSQAPKV